MNMTDTRLELMQHRKNPNCATTHSCVNEKEKNARATINATQLMIYIQKIYDNSEMIKKGEISSS